MQALRKRIGMMAVAFMTAALMAVGIGVATSSQAVAEEPVVLTVYEQANVSADPVMVKGFTRSEIGSLMTTATDSSMSYQYYKSGQWNVKTATSYITLEDLFEAAGIEVEGVDTVTAQQTVGDTFSASKDYYTMSNGKTYFGDSINDGTFSSTATSVAPILAYELASSTSSEADATVQSVANANLGSVAGVSAPTLLYGISKNDHNADGLGNCAGKRLAGNVDTIVITRGTYLTVSIKDTATSSAKSVDFTKQELMELASEGTIAVQYGKSADRATWATKVSSKYMELSALFDYLNCSLTDDAEITFSAPDGFSSSATWGTMKQGVYYPNLDTDEGAVSVPPSLALTAGMAGGAESNNGTPTVFTGVTSTSYAGNRLVGSVNSITVNLNKTPIASSMITSKKTSYTYSAKSFKPSLSLAGMVNGTDYKVSYKNASGSAVSSLKNAGKYKVTVTGIGKYVGSYAYTVTVNKASQSSMKVSTSNKKVSAAKVKKAAKYTTKVAVSKAKGKVTYSKVSGSSKLTISKTTGKIKVKKGTAKGTYKIKVKVKSASTANYNSRTITKTIKVVVK